MSESEWLLGHASIGKLLAKFAIPGIISMVVNALYNIVDQIFIGQGVGYLGNGATTVLFPMTSLSLAFFFLFGDGAASYISLKLGEGDKERASKGACAGIIGFVGLGILIMLIYLIFLSPFCRLFGASDAILPYAMDYGRIISIGIPFSALCVGGSSIIRADGNPRFNMIGLLTGCAINIVLDPIFIFVCGWGVKGAALATVLGEIANALLNVWYLATRLKSVNIYTSLFPKSFGYMFSVAQLGVASFINNCALVIGIAVRNNVLLQYGPDSIYGSDIPLAALGVTMKSFNIIFCIVMGLCVGAQPIFGYNYGAKNYDRVKKTFRLVIIISLIIGCAAFCIAQLFPMAIISIFGSESELYNEFGVMCLRIYLMMIPLLGINLAAGILFQALGYPAQSSIISLSKQIIFTIPPTIILPMFMGIVGVLWAGPVSDVLSAVIAIVLLMIYWKKMFSQDKADVLKQ